MLYENNMLNVAFNILNVYDFNFYLLVQLSPIIQSHEISLATVKYNLMYSFIRYSDIFIVRIVRLKILFNLS